jgi:hypothetical protein
MAASRMTKPKTKKQKQKSTVVQWNPDNFTRGALNELSPSTTTLFIGH